MDLTKSRLLFGDDFLGMGHIGALESAFGHPSTSITGNLP